MEQLRDDVDRHAITQALADNANKISRAAAQLGISRPTMYELLQRHGIRNVADEQDG